MTDDKDVKLQINEYHKLLKELRAEKINLPDEFVAGILIEKMPETWNNYKQKLKHKQKKLSLIELITDIIIEDTNRKVIQAAKGKEMATKANLMEAKLHNKRYNSKNNTNKKSDYRSNDFNPKFKTKGNCFVCGKPGHHVAQCRKRARGENHQHKSDNLLKPDVNLVEGNDDDDIVVALSLKSSVFDVRKWVVDSGATRHICANKEMFTSFEEGEDHVCLSDSRTSKALGKGKVVLKLTSGKTLALT